MNILSELIKNLIWILFDRRFLEFCLGACRVSSEGTYIEQVHQNLSHRVTRYITIIMTKVITVAKTFFGKNESY